MNGVLLGLALAAVAVLVLTLSAGLVMLALKSRLIVPGRWQTTWCVAGIAALPAICGALSWVLLAIPQAGTSCHCYPHGLHHPHLCTLHPELSAPVFWPALGFLSIWALLIAPRLWGIVGSLRETSRLMRVVRSISPVLVDATPVRLLDLGAPRAFSLGMFRPLITVDRALWEALSPDERRAVVHHEAGHAERRDGLTLLALRLLTALCPWQFGDALIESWRRRAERACDLRAAQVVRDGSLVAQALLAVERAGGRSRAGQSPRLAIGIADHGDLEERVLALLDERRRIPQLGNDLLALGAITAAIAVLLMVLPGNEFHHAVETVLGLAVHR